MRAPRDRGSKGPNFLSRADPQRIPSLMNYGSYRILLGSLFLLLLVGTSAAQTRYVTLVATNQYGPQPSLTIASNETARLVDSKVWYAQLSTFKQGITLPQQRSDGAVRDYTNLVPCTISGPATFILSLYSGAYVSYCTFAVESSGGNPQGTVVVPADSSGANIVLESSTDLVRWTNALPGLYTNTSIGHQFFRLRADRLP
jgi:hypothetical protein